MLAHTLISILAIAASVTARPSRSVSPQKMNINTKRATPPPDECAFITDPVFPFQIASAANTYLPYMAWASIYGCLCESDIPSRVTGNEFTFVYIVNEVGVANTTIATKKALSQAPGVQSCTYPPNSVPACNQSDPCNFTCASGMTRVGNQCVCASPNHMCYGTCTSGTCPSAGLRRRDAYLTQTGTVCPAGTEKCGVWGRWSEGPRRGYECIDTRSDLESCGGCFTPPPGEKQTGRDCTQIQGVSTVECSSGKCQVQSCREGWKVNSDGQSCEFLS